MVESEALLTNLSRINFLPTHFKPYAVRVKMPSEIKDIKIEPLQHDSKSNVDIGATVHGVDLNDLANTNFEIIHEALYKHKVLIFKGQPSILFP